MHNVGACLLYVCMCTHVCMYVCICCLFISFVQNINFHSFLFPVFFVANKFFRYFFWLSNKMSWSELKGNLAFLSFDWRLHFWHSIDIRMPLYDLPLSKGRTILLPFQRGLPPSQPHSAPDTNSAQTTNHSQHYGMNNILKSKKQKRKKEQN